jgi:hypothetical protein
MAESSALGAPAAPLESEITNRVDPRACCQGVPNEGMQTFDPARHTSSTHSVQLRNVTGCLSVSDVCEVGSGVALAQLLIVLEHLIKLDHHTIRLKS